MDIAIVTGAETPIGLRIVQSLVHQGCCVHGIGNNFSKVTYADPQFNAHPVDLTDLEAVASTLGNILETEQRLDLLVHAIDVTPGAPFEKLSPGNLEAVLKIGLLGPVMMTRLALPNLLRFRGQLINIITSNKHGNAASAANALIEGGLREMNEALFDRGRDAGLRVTNCVLRQNTELLSASVSDEALAQSHIDLEDVARTIEQLIDPKAVNVPSEVVLHPRLSPAADAALPDSILPLDIYEEVVLPPKEYCPPKQPKIPTAQKQGVHRTIPYTDDEMEDKIAAAIEDFEAHPERYDEKPKPAPFQQNRQNQPRRDNDQQGQGSDGQSKRRRRRRGGRNRNKGHRDEGASQKQDHKLKPAAPTAKPEAAKESQKPEAKKEKPAKPKPKMSADASPREKPAKKTVVKKTAKKAAKKAAKKKAPAGSAPRKSAKKAVKKKAAKTSTGSARGKKAAKKEG